MNTFITQSAAPQLLFFFTFYLAFMVMELLLIWGVTRLELKHWEFMIDTVIRFSVHHGRRVRLFFYAILLLVLGTFFVSMNIFTVLRAATKELQIFSFLMLLTIGLIYFRAVRRHARLSIDLKIQTYLFLLISGFLMMFMIRLADQVYGRYEHFVNTQLVSPTVREVKTAVDEQKTAAALDRLREKVRQGECPIKNFASETEANLVQLVYLTTDVEFQTSFAVDDPSDPMNFLKGYACEDEGEIYLLTFGGSWYSVKFN